MQCDHEILINDFTIKWLFLDVHLNNKNNITTNQNSLLVILHGGL